MQTLHSNLVIFQSFLQNRSISLDNLFTFQSGYIPMGNRKVSHFICNLYIPIWLYSNEHLFYRMSVRGNLYIPIWLYSNYHIAKLLQNSLYFTFQSGYIPIKTHQKLCILQHRLYIPIWLYSNPSTIIPHIYRLWKLLFVDLRFLIHPTAIFFASYSYYLCLDLYYSGFVYLPIFKVYHRLTIILVQLMFYINLV